MEGGGGGECVEIVGFEAKGKQFKCCPGQVYMFAAAWRSYHMKVSGLSSSLYHCVVS